jgi:formylglycine-generating enzyme required for sulfatase activity/serine/threonine protein kinase
MDQEAMQPEVNLAGDSSSPRYSGRLLKPGESFDKYRVVKCLSFGLLANYYHMQHARDLSDVTVCVFHHRTAADPECLARLQGLQQTLQGVDHEAIPKIRDCMVIDGLHCMLLDLVKGQSLSQYLSVHGTPGAAGVGVEPTTRIVALLLGLLGYAHTQGSDHRDLDTDLVFVQDDGSLQILGLGVKAALGVDLFESIVSSSVSPLVSSENAARLNSFDIMSPEYRSGIAEDCRVDVYAVGCIAYWLLTGRKANGSEFQPPSSLVEGLPASWDEWIVQMTTREREQRNQSCRIALIALKAQESGAESGQASFIQRQVDHIPVPKAILERGDRATRIFRLLLIGLVGVVLTALASSFLRVTFMDTFEYEPLVAQVVAEGQVPNLQLQLSPAGARVSFRGHQVDFVATDARLDLSVRPGDYMLRVAAPDYREQVVAVSVAKDTPSLLAVDLARAWASLRIQSVPGASVFVVDAGGVSLELGVTDGGGLLHADSGLVAGRYDIVVRKQGYVPVTLEDQLLEVGQPSEFELPLQVSPSIVTVHTSPVGARVLLDGIDVGVSPLTLELHEAGGNPLIAVHLDGYRSSVRRVQFQAGKDRLIDFGQLLPRAGELSFDLRFDDLGGQEAAALIEDLEVELDGVVLSYGSSELKRIQEGAHSVRLLHPLYRSAVKAVAVRDQEETVVAVRMVALPGQIEFVAPAGLAYQVKLNGEVAKHVDGTIRVPANQLIELEVRIQDYLTMIRRMKVKPNERLAWKLDPVPIPGPVSKRQWTVPYQGLQFVWVEAGSYQMGSPMREVGRLPNEGPQTRVDFSGGFWVGAHEVTQAQYSRIMDENPSAMVAADHPVENVTWAAAQRYCEALNELEHAAGRLPPGYVYRLPTEAEWEFAARAGTILPFAFGSTADASRGNFRGVYPVDGAKPATGNAEHYGTLPVGSYAPNAGGLYDVHGNVAEWTMDYYNGRLAGGSLVDPRPRKDGRRIAVRGGSWEDTASRVRCAARAEMRANTQSDAIGFRVVLAPAF